MRCKVEPLGGRMHALGPSEAVGDRCAHVRAAQLREHRAVGQRDEAMHDGLRMDQDVELGGRQSEQMMRLDQLEPLVHQRRRIDGHLGSHRPVRMIERLLGRGFGHLRAAPGAEWTAGRREADGLDQVVPGVRHDLKRRGMLRVDRQQRGARSGDFLHEKMTCRDEAFLGGERGRSPLADSSERRLQARGADDRRHHPIGRAARRFDQRRFPRRGLDSRAGERRFEVGMATLIGDHREPGLMQDRELGEAVRVAASGQRDDLVRIRIAADEIERALPDRAGRAENGDAAAARRPRGNLDAHRCQGRTHLPLYQISKPLAGLAGSRSAIKAARTAARRRLSIRSSNPPWPGMSALMSLVPNRRFTALSIRSPI